MVSINKPSPTFTLPNVDGVPVSLSYVFSEQHFALLVFLRHLG